MRRLAPLVLASVALAAYLGIRALRPAGGGEVVVVYVSEDQVFAEPILRDFQRETGITVRAVYDTEEAKSTGVLNRLLAEKDHPRADVYWANEPFRAEVLKQRGVAAPYHSPAADGIPPAMRDPDGCWTGFSARLRVLLVNTAVADPPTSLLDYVDPDRRGRGTIANPLFGTTTAHVAALFSLWGEARARAFLDDLRRNAVQVTTSNGESADLVAAGRADFALVDSDDAVARLRRGLPVSIVYPDQQEGGLGCLVVPNAVVLVRGGPHPEAARRLVDYLLSPDTEAKLARADCAQLPLHPGVAPPPELASPATLRLMPVDYAAVARTMVTIQPVLRDWAGL